jgi:glucan phosphoethanolaminetransferase (alkaline phosphatase superfamily)
MQIDLSDEQYENASASIRSSLEFDSNVTVESDSHSLKHNLARIVTQEGIQIDLSDKQQKKALASIRLSLEFDSNINVDR